MKGGVLEPTKDSDTLFDIYKKIDVRGYLKEPLTDHEQVLIFALAKWIKEKGGKDE